MSNSSAQSALSRRMSPVCHNVSDNVKLLRWLRGPDADVAVVLNRHQDAGSPRVLSGPTAQIRLFSPRTSKVQLPTRIIAEADVARHWGWHPIGERVKLARLSPIFTVPRRPMMSARMENRGRL